MSKRDREGFLVPDVPAKKQRTESPDTTDFDLPDIDPSLLDEDLEALLDSAEDVEDFTPSSLEKICVQFEKAISVNQEQRIKYANDPTKFMQSEIELDKHMKELSILAVSPELYEKFVALGSLDSLIRLLTHENTDIANDVVSLFNELFDPFVISQHPGSDCLPKAFMSLSGIDFLLENMKRLDEKIEEESTGLYNSLSVIEHLTEVIPECQEEIVKKSDLVLFLIQKIKLSPIQQNQFYASEILSIVISNSETARELLGKTNALEQILIWLSKFRKQDPESSTEEEILENLFVCVASAVSHFPNHKRFDELEGMQLMLIFIRRAMFCKRSALKIIDYQISNDPDMCSKFVQILGLKTLFSAFMKKKRKKKSKKYNHSDTEDEEHILSIIASLFMHTSGNDLQRLLHKFAEGDGVKVERLVDLYEKNMERTKLAEKQISLLVEERNATYEDYNPKDDEAEFDLLRLEAGFEPETRKKLKAQVNLQGSLLDVYAIVSQYVEDLDHEKEKNIERLEKASAELFIELHNNSIPRTIA